LGSGLEYSTYLGGSGDDPANGLAVDLLGNAYVGGFTNSSNFPTTLGAISACVRSAFVTKIDPSLIGPASLVYSTCLGPNSDANASAIAVDAGGDAFVNGTASSAFPTTSGAFQPTFGGGSSDAF